MCSRRLPTAHSCTPGIFPGPSGAPLVLYFGGNAEDVSWMLGEADAAPTVWLAARRLSRLWRERRLAFRSGVGRGRAALVRQRFSPQSKKIYVLGRSLGSGVAVRLAAERKVDAVILVTPFDSMVAVGKRHYPFLPVSLLLKHRFDSVSLAPRITAPLLCLVADAR